MFKWLKSLFKRGEIPKKVSVNIPLKPLKYQNQLLCKLHQNYSGATLPINNCNVCLEIYNQKLNVKLDSR